MLKNYLLIAFRNLRRQKAVSAINILGFTVGIVCCLFIAFYIMDECSYDQFNEKKARIYRMAMDFHRENGTIGETAFSKEGTLAEKLDEKMLGFIAKYISEEAPDRYHPVFQALTDIHLQSNRHSLFTTAPEA